MRDDFLPYGKHCIDEDDIEAVVDVLRHGALTGGPKVDEFERAFAKKIGTQFAVVVSNGTAALHVALLASGFKAGDTAIVPSLTFLSTANVVLMAGGKVQFADVCPDTGLMTPETFKKALAAAKGPVKAVMPVHLTGQTCDMENIASIAAEYDVTVISDCCHALGAEYVKEAGRPGDGVYEAMACFSLHPVKSIAMGEGGVVTTNSKALADKMCLLRSHDMRRNPDEFVSGQAAFDGRGEPNPWFYEMHELGYNYRATDFQCALALSQLGKLDGFVERRRHLAGLYDDLLRNLSNLLQPNIRVHNCLSAWHLYAVRINFAALGIERSEVMRKLQEKGIGTQVHYIPVHKQPFYTRLYGKQILPGADEYYANTLSLPLFPAMSDDDPKRVISELQAILSR